MKPEAYILYVEDFKISTDAEIVSGRCETSRPFWFLGYTTSNTSVKESNLLKVPSSLSELRRTGKEEQTLKPEAYKPYVEDSKV